MRLYSWRWEIRPTAVLLKWFKRRLYKKCYFNKRILIMKRGLNFPREIWYLQPCEIHYHDDYFSTLLIGKHLKDSFRLHKLTSTTNMPNEDHAFFRLDGSRPAPGEIQNIQPLHLLESMAIFHSRNQGRLFNTRDGRMSRGEDYGRDEGSAESAHSDHDTLEGHQRSA